MHIKIIITISVFVFMSCSVKKQDLKTTNLENFDVPNELQEEFAVSDQMPDISVDDKVINTETEAYRFSKSSDAKSKSHKGELEKAKISKKKLIFPQRNKGNVPFSPGEKIIMDLTYLGFVAGTFEVEVLPYKYIKGRKVYHIRGYGKSSSVFSMFYRVDDVAETFMDYNSLFSHKFSMKLDETKQQRDLLELYDQEKKRVHYWERLDHKKHGFRLRQFTKEIQEYTQDAISAAYYLRTLDLKVGATYKFPVVSNGKPWEISAKVVRKEKLHTAKGEFDSIVVKPETRFEGVLKKKGDIYFWLSDDEHKAFLKIDAKVKIGKVIGYLKDIKYGNKSE